MADPFLAEIRIMSFGFPPKGWALCNGQLLPIAQNTALFSLLGTTYGGDGRVTFALPDLTGSAPMQEGQGVGQSYRGLGQSGGRPTVTLQSSEMPSHTHVPMAVDAGGNSGSPVGNTWARASYGKGTTQWYSTAAPNQQMNPLSTQATGGGQPHNNMPPFVCVTFITALQGIFPPRP